MSEKVAAIRHELKPHQRKVVERMKEQPGLVVAHGLGSGKTLSSIAAQDALGLPSTVVVPASLKANYEKEREKHIEGTSPEAAITTLQRVARAGEVIDAPMLIVDEAHRAREVDSKTYQALKRNLSDKRMLLTASPFYNRPSDIAPLINIAAGERVLPPDQKSFEQRYVKETRINPSLWQRIRGAKPGTVQELNPRQANELKKVMRTWVDYHPGTKADFPDVRREVVKVPMTAKQRKLYDGVIGQAPPWVALKIKAGLPPSKQESKQLNAFASAVRQISLSTRAHAPKEPPQEPKVDTAFKRMKAKLEGNPRFKGVVYSNYLDAGVRPYKERLEQAGIPYGEFTGAMPKKERDQLVRDYNEGNKRVLLLSSAGGEGLDLKGTRLLQVLEPHWNTEKLKQVEGRGIRYRSHTHLPKKERNITVESYLATRPKAGLLEKLKITKPGGGIDEYLTAHAQRKEKLIGQFRGLMDSKEKRAEVWSPTALHRWRGFVGELDKIAQDGRAKKKVYFQGLTVHIDRPKGFVMEGVDEGGTPWKRVYKTDYGYLKGANGGDGDSLDVFVGPSKGSTRTFWARQVKPDGTFDEYKVFVGYDNKSDALQAYKEHIPPKLLSSMFEVGLDVVKALLGVDPEGTAKTAEKGDDTAALLEGILAHHQQGQALERAAGAAEQMKERRRRQQLYGLAGAGLGFGAGLGARALGGKHLLAQAAPLVGVLGGSTVGTLLANQRSGGAPRDSAKEVRRQLLRVKDLQGRVERARELGMEVKQAAVQEKTAKVQVMGKEDYYPTAFKVQANEQRAIMKAMKGSGMRMAGGGPLSSGWSVGPGGPVAPRASIGNPYPTFGSAMSAAGGISPQTISALSAYGLV